MTLEQFYRMRDDFHQRLDNAFHQVEGRVPSDKGASADVTDIAKDAWDLWKDGIAEISKVAGETYAEYVDQG